MTEAGNRSLQMLATALEKEERGRDAYLKAVSTCTNDLGKEMFRMLAADEGVHITRVKQIYEGLKRGKTWTDQWKSRKLENENLEALFRDRMARLGKAVKAETGDLEAVDVGMGFEQGAIAFYEQELKAATDPPEREFLDAMIREERSHFAALADVKLFLTNPDSWYIEHEHHRLDGA